MDCLHPIDLKKGFPVPCGKCIACKKKKQRDWIIRLTEEVKHASSAVFITLTYDDQHVPRDEIGNRVLSKRDIQLFLKRLRKKLGNKKIRYFICGEYGPKTLRPHYHGILFNLSNNLDYVTDVTLHSWNLGYVSCDRVLPARIAYVAKYCCSDVLFNHVSKGDNVHLKPFMMCSTKPGIGSGYMTDKMLEYHWNKQEASYTLQGGEKASLPRYFRDRIFDDQMKFDLLNKFKERRKDEYRRRQDKYAEDFRLYNRNSQRYLLVRSQEEDLNFYLDQFNFPKGDFTAREVEDATLWKFNDFVINKEEDKKEDYVRRIKKRHKESGKL